MPFPAGFLASLQPRAESYGADLEAYTPSMFAEPPFPHAGKSDPNRREQICRAGIGQSNAH